MKIENVRVIEFRGEEKRGISSRSGEPYRSRVAEIMWPDCNGVNNHTIVQMKNEVLDQWDAKGLQPGMAFDAQVRFFITYGTTGYKFANCHITEIF